MQGLVQAIPRGVPQSAERLGQLLILLAVLVVPWHYGSVTWQDQRVIALMAITVLMCVLVCHVYNRSRASVPRIVIPIVGLVVIGFLQLLPLPQGLWRWTTPGGAYAQRLEDGAERFRALLQKDEVVDGSEEIDVPYASTVTLAPLQTRTTLACMAAAGILVLATNFLFRSKTSRTLLLWCLALAAITHALVGILQSVSWNGWTLLPMPHPSCFSTFVSRNSAAQFYAIGGGAAITLLVAWRRALTASGEEKRYLVRYPAANALARVRRTFEDLILSLDPWSIICLFILIFLSVAVVAAGSRGGALAWFGASAITLIYAFGRDRQVVKYTIALIVICALAGILLVTLELEQTTLTRLRTVVDELESQSNPRYRLWIDTAKIPNMWWLGVGAGAYHFAILPVVTMSGSWFYHAESIYVETLADFGLPGLCLLFWALCLIVRRTQNARWGTRHAEGVGVVFAISVIALQSFVDFSLIIPAIWLSLGVLIGCWWQTDSGVDGSSDSRDAAGKQALIWWAAVGLFTAAWAVGIGPLSGFAESEKLEELAERQDAVVEVKSIPRFPENAIQAGRFVQRNAELLAARMPWPEQLADSKQRLCDAIVLAASARAADNAPLASLRQVYASDPQIVETLQKSDEFFVAGLQGSLLDWRAALGIIRADCGQFTAEAKAENLARLFLLTRFLPSLHTRIGTVLIGAGEREAGIEFWQSALEAQPQLVQQLADLVPNLVSVTEVKRILGSNPIAVVDLAHQLRDQPGTVEQLLGTVEPQRLRDVATTAHQWRLVAWYADVTGQTALAVTALRELAKHSPADHVVRFRLAQLLAETGQLREAIRWAREAERRSNGNPSYTEFLKQLEDQLQQQAVHDGAPP